MDRRSYYEAFCSHDSRFDGKFFVAVASTGIYCRPVCRARTPKEENCAFFSTAAEAEEAGYRPCLKCRPELAPGNSPLEASGNLARTAAREIKANCASGERLGDLASRLGCTDRHLRRVFEAEFHVSPLRYRQTCQLLLAKSLLTDTDLKILDVAMAVGFGSLRRFNAVFEKEYRLTPSALRKQRDGHRGRQDSFTVEIGYRPPYCWQEILDFLKARAIPGVEVVRDGTYLRTVRIKECVGWIAVNPSARRNTLAVTVAEPLIRVLPQVLDRVRALFDTDSDPQTIREALAGMERIDQRLPVYGLRVPGCFDPFETCVRAIVGQQITVKAATTLAGRLAGTLGRPVETKVAGLTHLFPTPEEIAREKEVEQQLGRIGILSVRGKTIAALAELFAQGTPVTKERLLAIKGIGPWTADYIALRVLDDPDVFLPTDHGVKTALKGYSKEAAIALADTWRPWRSYGVMNLWML